MLRQHVGQVPPVAGNLRAVQVERPIPVVGEAAEEAGELLEAPRVRVKAAVERAVVPLAHEARAIAGRAKAVGDRHLGERDSIKTAPVERVDGARALRIPAGQERGARGRAYRRARVVLREAHARGGEVVEVRGRAPALVEQPEVAVPHVVGEDDDDVRSEPVRHAACLPSSCGRRREASAALRCRRGSRRVRGFARSLRAEAWVRAPTRRRGPSPAVRA